MLWIRAEERAGLAYEVIKRFCVERKSPSASEMPVGQARSAPIRGRCESDLRSGN